MDFPDKSVKAGEGLQAVTDPDVGILPLFSWRRALGPIAHLKSSKLESKTAIIQAKEFFMLCLIEIRQVVLKKRFLSHQRKCFHIFEIISP